VLRRLVERVPAHRHAIRETGSELPGHDESGYHPENSENPFFRQNLVDVFVSSCFVNLRKPDVDIFRLALDIAQTPARQVVYIENTPMFVQIAEGLGIRSILHTDYGSTCAELASLELKNDKGFSHKTR